MTEMWACLPYVDGEGECLNEGWAVRLGYAYVCDRYCKIQDYKAWEEDNLEAKVKRTTLALGPSQILCRLGIGGGELGVAKRHPADQSTRGGGKDCSHLKIPAAQRLFDAQGPGDPHGLGSLTGNWPLWRRITGHLPVA